MNVKQRVEREREKPYKLTCLEGDYTAYFESKDAARTAKGKHQDKYMDHEMIITRTVFLDD